MARLTAIALLAALQLAIGIPQFMTEGPYWTRALLYHFFHANWWHLAVNAIAVWTIFDPKRKTTPAQVITAYAIAVLVYPLSFRPVIGLSNVLYAVLGLRTPPLRNPWWKHPSVLAFLIITVAMVFIPRFSATTHIAAFALGMGGAALGRWWQKLTQDARRYL